MNFLRHLIGPRPLAFLALLLIFLISGCDQGILPSDEDTSSLSDTSTEFSVSNVDGRLVFADIEAFANFMDSFIESGSMSLEGLGIIRNFTSLYASTVKLEEVHYEETDGDHPGMGGDFEIVEDPFFASVLNEFGEIQIGSSVFKYTRNYVYETSESNIESLARISMRNSDQTAFYGKYDGTKGVEIHEIKRASLHATELTGKAMVTAGCTSDFNKETKRRLGGASWITGWHYYHSAGAKSRSSRKAGWRWRNNTIDTIAVSSEYNLTSSSRSMISSSRAREGRRSSEVTIVLLNDFGFGAYIRGNISSNHTGTRLKKGVSCQTSVSGSSLF